MASSGLHILCPYAHLVLAFPFLKQAITATCSLEYYGKPEHLTVNSTYELTVSGTVTFDALGALLCQCG